MTIEMYGNTYPISTVIHISEGFREAKTYVVTETTWGYGRMLVIPICEYNAHILEQTVLKPKQPRYTQLMKSYGKERK